MHRTLQTLLRLILIPLCGVACSSQSLPTATLLPASTSFHQQDVRFRSGTLTLAGLLLIPEGAGPHPGAMFIQGSGDSDRTNLWALGIAEALAARGVAVLLPDKRGTGASEGDWRQGGFEEYARDAIAGVHLLQQRPEIDSRFVGVIGLSQGGQLAPLAADLSSDVAFVIDVSGAATTPVEQINLEMRNTFIKAGLDSEAVEAGMRLQSLAERYVRTGEWKPYADALEASKGTPLEPIAADFPQSESSWVWSWWRRIGDFDPMDHWKRLVQPGLVIYGKEDQHDNVPVVESVRRLQALVGAQQRLDVFLFEGSGHALYEPGRAELRQDFLDLLSTWIHRHHQNR